MWTPASWCAAAMAVNPEAETIEAATVAAGGGFPLFFVA